MTKPTLNHSMGPPLLEQLGALCSLLAHDLANQLCVISGSASFAQLVPDDPKRLASALETIARASEAAGHAVSSFGEYRRTLPTAFVPGPARKVVEALARYAGKAGWKCLIPEEVKGSVSLPPQWAVFAARSIKTELYSRPVVLNVSVKNGTWPGRLAPAPSDPAAQGPALQPGLQILFAYQASEPLSIKEVRARYENLGLLAVFELNRMLGGTLDSRTAGCGNQEIELWLPLDGRR